jgi:hypothetical protein
MLRRPSARRRRPSRSSSRAPTAYLNTYAQKVSGVTLDEMLMLAENSMTIRGTVPQRVSSDLILLNVGGEILGMRDVYAVDTRRFAQRVADCRLLAEPTPAKWQTAQQYAARNTRYICARTWCSGSVIRRS